MNKFGKAMLVLVCSIAVFMGVGVEVKAADVTYYDTVEAAGAALREGMTARKGTIEIGFTTTKELDQSIIDEFMEEAFKHTGNPIEGDYLRGHYSSYKASATGKVKNGVYNWVFTYTVKYKTTAAQEEATDKAVADMISEMKLSGKDTFSKIKSIHDYMCKNVTYDWDHKKDDACTDKYTAYGACVNGKAVCEGYALLLYRLFLENDIDARVIEGTGNGEAHSWDIVKIDDHYYYIDSTWNSTYGSHDWFLNGKDDFGDHKAKSEYTSSSFTKKYPISDTHYWYGGVHDAEFESHKNPATFAKAGAIEEKCTICGKVTSSKKIAKVSTPKLAATVYTYNGEARKPAVTVKDAAGNTLKKGTDYTLSYAKGRKNVGQYSVKVTLKGKYSGTKTLKFKIRPKATKITSLTGSSKGFTVKYNKQTSQTTGYQIQYSTSSSFDSVKSVLVKDNKTVSKKIAGLNAKKTYYVRVRTYKTVKINGESVKIYSAWSDKKSVKTKG